MESRLIMMTREGRSTMQEQFRSCCAFSAVLQSLDIDKGIFDRGRQRNST